MKFNITMKLYKENKKIKKKIKEKNDINNI